MKTYFNETYPKYKITNNIIGVYFVDVAKQKHKGLYLFHENTPRVYTLVYKLEQEGYKCEIYKDEKQGIELIDKYMRL